MELVFSTLCLNFPSSFYLLRKPTSISFDSYILEQELYCFIYFRLKQSFFSEKPEPTSDVGKYH